MDAAWLAKWNLFVLGGAHPGLIPNESLVHSNDGARSVNVRVWQFFQQRYGGGGPGIVDGMDQKDSYASDETLGTGVCEAGFAGDDSHRVLRHVQGWICW